VIDSDRSSYDTARSAATNATTLTTGACYDVDNGQEGYTDPSWLNRTNAANDLLTSGSKLTVANELAILSNSQAYSQKANSVMA